MENSEWRRVGSIDRKFKQPLVLSRGVEPGIVMTCGLKSVNTETAHVTGFGAEVAIWKASAMTAKATPSTQTRNPWRATSAPSSRS